MPTYGHLIKAHKALARSLRKYSLASLVSSIGDLMTMPEFQSSALRLELLQHFAVTNARGKQEPRTCSLKFWLKALGEGWAGRKEDPVEDVFVSRVLGSNQDYLIFQGLYESPAFCLQRFIDILNNMPDHEPFINLKRSAYALLVLSNETVKRSRVAAFAVGRTEPLRTITESLFYHTRITKKRIIFEEEDLSRLGILREDIEKFILCKEDYINFEHTTCTDSLLNRHPLLEIDSKIYLTLPSSISIAIRCMIIEFCLYMGYEDILNQAYVDNITNALKDIPILGCISRPPFFWKKINNLFFNDFSTWIDEGRLLHFYFVVDNFSDYEVTGFVDPHPNSTYFSQAINNSVNEAYKHFYSEPHFREGLSLIVMCSWGRPIIIENIGINNAYWRTEFIGVPELISMSSASSFSPLDLWNLLDMRDKLSQSGINLINTNGLFNLYAWCEQLDGHLTPDEQLPDIELNQKLIIPIQQNSLLEARRISAQVDNLHFSKTWDERIVRVIRFEKQSFFKEDEVTSLYVSIDIDDLKHKKLLAVYETESRNWWVTIEMPNLSDHDLQYRLFEAVAYWLEHSVKIIEETIHSLPEGPILWVCCFEERKSVSSIEPTDFAELAFPYEQAKEKIKVSITDNIIRVNAHDGFLIIFQHPENIGERLLVEAFVAGLYRLSGQILSSRAIDLLVQRIVPDQWARYVHFWVAKDFQDFFQDKHREPILISKTDDAFSRIGLGWLAREPGQGARIEGVESCCEYLNNLVAKIGARIQLKLKSYNREQFLLTLLHSYEDLKIHFRPWFKTPHNVISLHQDKKTVVKEATWEISRFYAASLSTRLLIEIALCECPQNSERSPGRLDISRLLADAMALYNFGGCSDAIRYGSKSPELRITPSGGVHTNFDFDETVVMPYEQTLANNQYENAANTYKQYFHEAEITETTHKTVEPEFLEAWTEAFGFTIDDVRIFVDALKDEGIKRQKLVFLITEDELYNLSYLKSLNIQNIRKILATFSLVPRRAWNFTPHDFRDKDWHPWRFRRRLSLISRPIIQLNDTSLRYIITPGLIRDGIGQTFQYCYRGSYNAKDLPIGRMRSWVGKSESKRGHKFNKEIAELLKDLGWEVRSDIKISEIINKFNKIIDKKTAKMYGDIDVFAWKKNRVIAIECKDLELAKTMSEISRQIHDFRGELNNRNKPDRLKRHLLRIKLFNDHKKTIKRFVGEINFSSVEGLLVFSRIVPMYFTEFASKNGVRFLTKDQLENL